MTPSVFIGIPSTGIWQAEFGMALAGLMTRSPVPSKVGPLWSTCGSLEHQGQILPAAV